MQRIQAMIPNTLSVTRLCIAFVILALTAFPPSTSLLTVQILALVGVVSDKLDGTLARYWKVESDFGKRIESFADPIFALCVGVYVGVRIGLPEVFINAALLYLIVGVLGRIAVSVIAKQLFYEKSQITRVGVGATFVLLLMYLYNIPGRDWLMWFMVFYGAVMCINYYRMMIRFVMKKPTP